jgi:hypothetical protein
MSSVEADVMQRHVADWQGRLIRGMALAFGPVLDPEPEQAARAISASDPAVEGGACAFEVVPMRLVRPG